MRRTVAVWSFAASPGKQQDAYHRIADELERDGWKVPKIAADEPMLRIMRGQQMVEVFPQQKARHAAEVKKDDESTPRTYYVVFVDSMTGEQIDTALQTLLERDAPESVLVQFAGVWFNSKPRVQEYFEEHPPQLMTSLTHVARWQMADKQLEEARRSVLRAHALQKIAHHQSGTSKELKKLAKEVGIEKLPKLPDPSVFDAIGIVDLRDGKPATRTVGLGEAMILLVDQEEDHQKFVSVTPIRQRGLSPEYTLRIQDTEFRKGSSSWGNRTQGDATDCAVEIAIPPDRSLQVRSRKVEGTGSFEVTIDP